MRHGRRQMGGANVTLRLTKAENDQIGLFPLRDFENLLARRPVYDQRARIGNESGFAIGKRSEMIERELFEFVRLDKIAGLGIFNHVKQSEMRLLFLRETHSKSKSCVRVFAEVGGEQDLPQFFRARTA